jgi:dipeptidyl aminopeptidase/acylaminoacyl peptidase
MKDYKNNHLVEIIPNKYVYHTSNPMFRDKISKEGLIPKGKSETWLSDTKIDGKVIFAVNSDNKKDRWDSTYDDDIYRIDTTNLNNKWYNDPNFDVEDKRIITFEKIPRNSIKLLYKGTGLDTL